MHRVIKRRKYIHQAFLVVALLMLVIGESYSMSLFDIGKVCLFSKTDGKIVLNGEPVAGVKIIRKSIFQTKTKEEVTTTDNNGVFHFDASFTRSLAKYMPLEGVITQKIIIQTSEKEHEGWTSVKRNFEENGELGGKPLDLVCELSQEESTFTRVGRHQIYGICDWK